MPEPDMSVWTGRVDTADGPKALRWHQMVKPLAADSPPGIVLIGFACDEGVRRNGGRVGAKDGPQAIRKALANLAWHQDRSVHDAGDVYCDGTDLEGAQEQLAKVVEAVIRAGHRPLVLGGGHETAWGTFQGVVASKPDVTIGVINIDAHFDLRADEPGNSGTPFNQMAKWCEKHGNPFRYLCLGISAASNTEALFERAIDLRAQHMLDIDLFPWRLDGGFGEIAEFEETVDQVHLSVDLDVLPAATMPAVSSPAAHGVALEAVESLIASTLLARKCIAIDLVELNPIFDTDGRGAKVAARLAWQAAKDWLFPKEAAP